MAYRLRGSQPNDGGPAAISVLTGSILANRRQELVSPHFFVSVKLLLPSRTNLEYQIRKGSPMPRRSNSFGPRPFRDHLIRLAYTLSATTALIVASIAPPNRLSASQDNSPAREPAVAARPIHAEAPSEYHLAYKFRKDQDVRMLMVVGSQIRIQKGAKVELNVIQSATERHFRVASLNSDGSAVLDLVIDRVKIAVSTDNGTPTAYDTRDSVEPPKQFENVKECIGRHTQVRVDTRGRVSALDGSQLGPSEDPDFLVVLPEKPVRIGQEWFDDYQARVQVTKDLTQKVTLRRRYTLTAVNNNVAIIRVATAEVTPVNDPQVLAGMVQLTPSGTILLNLGQGSLTLRDLRCERTEVGVLGTASSITGVSNTRETLR
jgi:hypothetical protein